MPVKKLKIHFIGIGGIGVSALAQYYLSFGHKVSGSDLNSSEITKTLEKQGVKTFIGKHKDSNIKKQSLVNLVIYSPAVKPDNPELKKAKKLKIKCQSYPQALGELTKQYFTIAITGTHGKSTTTSMIGLILVKAGLDPTIIVGTKVKEFGNSNYRNGKGKYLVIEACEHEESFLEYWPDIAVITNIEADHLDYYKNFKNVVKGFRKFLHHIDENGYLAANKDDKNLAKLKYSDLPFKTKHYSLKQAEAEKLRKILKVPGQHNVSNALASLTVARILGISDRISFQALSEYKGCWRRFEIKKTAINGKCLTIVSDYGHHPTEIRATLKAAREKFLKSRIWCVFQPHQYQRTYYLSKDFVRVFRSSPIDKIIITDIFDVAGREEKSIKKRVSSEKLAETAKRGNVVYVPKEKLLGFVRANVKDIDVLVVMGAGDIYQLVPKLDKRGD
ncbi:MAG: UDP-N-acetylmuramate--L-alanine ligase [Candidatus Nealsonbacteria bacterium]|nr:UDP-N-acetylmuramate--L-alanine ligase [Candidatus Nealsonbacteria bacterium]